MKFFSTPKGFKSSSSFRLKKLYLALLQTKRILNFFTGNPKSFQFTHMLQVASGRSAFTSLIASLGLRISFLMIKTGFGVSGKQVQQLLRHKHLFINNFVVLSSNTLLRIKDCMSFQTSFVQNYKFVLICNFFKTVFFFNFLKRQKRIFKKLQLSTFYSHFKFSSFVEINFRIFVFEVVTKPTTQEFFAGSFLSPYNCAQLKFIL